MPTTRIQFGLNHRDFPANWRQTLDEIAFAAAHGFAMIQFHGREAGLRDDDWGAPATSVGTAARAARLIATIEIITRIDATGRTANGDSPLDVLHARPIASRAARGG